MGRACADFAPACVTGVLLPSGQEQALGSGDIPERWPTRPFTPPEPFVRSVLVVKRVQMSRSQLIVWWVFVSVLIAAGLLISAAEVGMAEWLNARIGWVGGVAGCGVIFAALLWIAAKNDD